MNGGEPGQRSTKLLERRDGTQQVLPAKCEGIEVKEGDLLHFNTWGGGGWGDPLLRDTVLVLQDIEKRLVSSEGAIRYGVVLTHEGSLDEEATISLREELRLERGKELPMFNFGGDIEDIRSRCLSETKLEPPVTPTFIES